MAFFYSLLPLTLLLQRACFGAPHPSTLSRGMRFLRSLDERVLLTNDTTLLTNDTTDDAIFKYNNSTISSTDDYYYYVGGFFYVPTGASSVTFESFYYSLYGSDGYPALPANRTDCPVSGGAQSTAGPACAASAYDDSSVESVWICRQLYNVVTGVRESETICTDPYEIIDLIDECGCCDGLCPEICTCPCTTSKGGDGVRILWNATTNEGYSTNGDPPLEECLDVKYATSAMARGANFLSCLANCSAPVSTDWMNHHYGDDSTYSNHDDYNDDQFAGDDDDAEADEKDD